DQQRDLDVDLARLHGRAAHVQRLGARVHRTAVHGADLLLHRQHAPDLDAGEAGQVLRALARVAPRFGARLAADRLVVLEPEAYAVDDGLVLPGAHGRVDDLAGPLHVAG